jgi:hypothetical protein
MTVDYTATTATTSATGAVIAGTIATDSGRLSRPGAIPKDELFFWTRHWQEGEAESAAARARGEVREFASGRDAVRWLLSDDDE